MKRRWSLLLLLIPFVALLWPPFYAGLQPMVMGVPYFIWYQFLWTILGAALTYITYRLVRTEEPE